MLPDFVCLKKLSTGTHYLAFFTDPPRALVLRPTTVAVLSTLLDSDTVEAAEQDFARRVSGRLNDPQGTFRAHAAVLLTNPRLEVTG